MACAARQGAHILDGCHLCERHWRHVWLLASEINLAGIEINVVAGMPGIAVGMPSLEDQRVVAAAAVQRTDRMDAFLIKRGSGSIELEMVALLPPARYFVPSP